MKPIHWLIAAFVVLGGAMVLHDSPDAALAMRQSSEPSAYGFVNMLPFNGKDPNTVYVLAAENCPHAAAQRADHLTAALEAKSVPVKRIHSVSFALPQPQWIPPDGMSFASREEMEQWQQAHQQDREQFEAHMEALHERVSAVMDGTLPVVFVHGRARNNPSLTDVLGEFHSH